MPNVLAITPLSDSEAARIRSVDPSVELVQAGGWFDGEVRETWPAFTVARYMREDALGHGTRAERDQLLQAAEIIFGSWPFPLDLRARAPRLRWFHQRPAGASNIRRGDLWGSDVMVTTSRGYGDTQAIAEYAVAGLLMFAKGLGSARQHEHRLSERPMGLADRTVLILGAGGIGRAAAGLCAGLGLRVVGVRSDSRAEPGDADSGFAALVGPNALADVAAEADFLIVACQWTPATTGLVDARLLAALRPGAVLVNVARGEIVDEQALVAALDSGQLRGALLDVYSGEFEHPAPQALAQHPKVLLTPHTSGMTDRPAHRSLDVFVANLERYLAGRPLQNLIDWQRGY